MSRTRTRFQPRDAKAIPIPTVGRVARKRGVRLPPRTLGRSVSFGEQQSLFGIPLPKAICGLTRGEITNNELTNPGLGYTVPYNGPVQKATIYIYDLGLAAVPDDPTSEVVLNHFNHNVQQIIEMKSAGFFSSVEVKSKYGTGDPATGIEFLCCEFRAVEDGKALETFLFLTSYSKLFVKVRFTTPLQDRSSIYAREFANAVAELLWPERKHRERQ